MSRFPAVERVGVVRQQGQQLGVGVVEVQHHRRAETAQDGRHGFGVHVDEGQCFAGLGQHKHTCIGLGLVPVRQLQRQFGAIRIQQPQSNGDHERFFAGLPRCGWAALVQREGVGACGSVVLANSLQARRAGLAVPAFELRQQAGQVRIRVGIGY